MKSTRIKENAMQERDDQFPADIYPAARRAFEIAAGDAPMPECATVSYAANHWAAAVDAPVVEEHAIWWASPQLDYPWHTRRPEMRMMQPGIAAEAITPSWPTVVQVQAWLDGTDRLGYGRRSGINREAIADAYVRLAQADLIRRQRDMHQFWSSDENAIDSQGRRPRPFKPETQARIAAGMARFQAAQ